eukprot:m.53274 g.53274  ORF g.53274 m.53274 type:complete len:80 (-) comp12779_c0_seq2:424-663(-)
MQKAVCACWLEQDAKAVAEIIDLIQPFGFRLALTPFNKVLCRLDEMDGVDHREEVGDTADVGDIEVDMPVDTEEDSDEQ